MAAKITKRTSRDIVLIIFKNFGDIGEVVVKFCDELVFFSAQADTYLSGLFFS